MQPDKRPLRSDKAAPESGELTAAALLADAPVGSFQRRVVALAAAAIIMDGLDNQLLGFIIPSLLDEWSLSKATIAVTVALSLLSMSVGTAMAGILGDRFGRRPMLVGSVLIFGLATLASAAASDLVQFTVLRMIAGLGLGGAMPNATALVAEYAPFRRRGLMVTLGIVCVPLGGFVAGLLATLILPSYGWRLLCIVSGVVPLIGGLALLAWLPESPALLAAKGRLDEVNSILAKCGVSGKLTVAVAAEDRQRGAFLDLFRGGLAVDTVLAWTIFFASLLSVYSVFSWGPAFLAGQGLDARATSSGLTAYNLGGVIGAISGGYLIDRFGSKRTTVSFAVVGALLAAYVVFQPITADASIVWIWGFFTLLGASVNGLQTNLFALSANIYPVELRATGVGWALAVGRLGAVTSALTGGLLLDSGSHAYFALIAGATLVSAGALAMLRRHIVPAHRPQGLSARSAGITEPAK